jgi:hypothetical protein
MISRLWWRMQLAIARWQTPRLSEDELRARWHRLTHPDLW